MLAVRVRTILKAVANDSPTQLARILNGVPPGESASRTGELGRRIENDRRTIARWLAGDALMERPNRLKLLQAANTVLLARGDEPFPADYLEVEGPDPLEEVNRKLDLLLAHFGLAERDEDLQVPAALDRLERQPNGDERRGRGVPRRRVGDG